VRKYEEFEYNSICLDQSRIGKTGNLYLSMIFDWKTTKNESCTSNENAAFVCLGLII
jgi:hypothetical protein